MSLRHATSSVIAFGLSPYTVFAQSATGLQTTTDIPGIVLSLLVVVAVIIAAAWIVRRSPIGAVARKAGPLKIIASLPLGPKERLVLIEALGRRRLVGVSPAGIFALDQTESAVIPSADLQTSTEEGPKERSFQQTIDLAQSGQFASES